HTIDVRIDTGAGGDGFDIIAASPFTFTVEQDTSVIVEEEEVVSGSSSANINTADSDGNSVQIELNFGTATGSTGDVIVVVQNIENFIAANTAAQLQEKGFELDDGELIFVTDEEDTFVAVGFITEIDVSALSLPDGTEVTLNMTYDDAGLSDDEEENVRLMHQPSLSNEWEVLVNANTTINEGDEVDIELNFVYGTTTGFSMFGPALLIEAEDEDEDEDNGSGGGSGGGGGGTVTVPRDSVLTLPDTHFMDNPLDKVQVSNSGFMGSFGLSLAEARINQQVSVSAEFANYQRAPQDYAFIVQVIDANGFITDISWQQGTLEGGRATDVSTLWTPKAEGTYTVKIFIWNSISAAPEPLSQVIVKTIPVT
ncbi:MAG: hypothetical protein ACRD8W_31475, partial [Nitrososphaeraceae archaeon]